MHYGHPDVFDRVFHITRGGISKASRVINISEDIYAGHFLLAFIDFWRLSFFNLYLYLFIYSVVTGFNSTLRQGNITHHEYIQVWYHFCTFIYINWNSFAFEFLMINYSVKVGKGRDVGLNQIALFEGKVAGGNGEQVLSRDVYRLGQLFDFFRMLSFYFTTVGYYACTMVSLLPLPNFYFIPTYYISV